MCATPITWRGARRAHKRRMRRERRIEYSGRRRPDAGAADCEHRGRASGRAAPVIDAMGAPTDGDVDIGSALNAWRDVFANGLVVGGARADIAALAGSAAVYVFDASDATFSLARHSNRCPNAPVVRSQRWRRRRHRPRPRRFGQRRRGGVAATVTIGGMTYSSGATAGGEGDLVRDGGNLSTIRYSIPGGAGTFGADGHRGGDGAIVLRYFVHSGLSEGDAISIVVPAGGEGGAGGETGDTRLPDGAAGSDGVSGLAIMLALP